MDRYIDTGVRAGELLRQMYVGKILKHPNGQVYEVIRFSYSRGVPLVQVKELGTVSIGTRGSSITVDGGVGRTSFKPLSEILVDTFLENDFSEGPTLEVRH